MRTWLLWKPVTLAVCLFAFQDKRKRIKFINGKNLINAVQIQTTNTKISVWLGELE
jgi:hypothetical protein